MGVGYPLDGVFFTRRNELFTYRGKVSHFTPCFRKLFSLFIAAHLLNLKFRLNKIVGALLTLFYDMIRWVARQITAGLIATEL